MHLPLNLHLFLFVPPNTSTVNMESFEEVPTQTLREEISLLNTFGPAVQNMPHSRRFSSCINADSIHFLFIHLGCW